MERSLASPAALQRVGAGLVLGATILLALAFVVLPEIAVLLVIGIGMGIYVVEQREELTPGLALGIAAAGIVLVLDRQVDPLGATVARLVVLAVVIGVAIVLGSLVIERFAGGTAGEAD